MAKTYIATPAEVNELYLLNDFTPHKYYLGTQVVDIQDCPAALFADDEGAFVEVVEPSVITATQNPHLITAKQAEAVRHWIDAELHSYNQ
jgi:hypothetical protein